MELMSFERKIRGKDPATFSDVSLYSQGSHKVHLPFIHRDMGDRMQELVQTISGFATLSVLGALIAATYALYCKSAELVFRLISPLDRITTSFRFKTPKLLLLLSDNTRLVPYLSQAERVHHST